MPPEKRPSSQGYLRQDKLVELRKVDDIQNVLPGRVLKNNGVRILIQLMCEVKMKDLAIVFYEFWQILKRLIKGSNFELRPKYKDRMGNILKFIEKRNIFDLHTLPGYEPMLCAFGCKPLPELKPISTATMEKFQAKVYIFMN